MKFVLVVLLVAVAALTAPGVWQRWQNAKEEITMSVQSDSSTGAAQEPLAKADAILSALRAPLAPEIVSDTWLNSNALNASELRGKVVLVEFWTFG